MKARLLAVLALLATPAAAEGNEAYRPDYAVRTASLGAPRAGFWLPRPVLFQNVCVAAPASAGCQAIASLVAPGTTSVSGCTNRLLYGDASAVLNCEAALTYTAATNTLVLGTTTTAGTATTTWDDAMAGSSATDNFLNITGTTPTTLSAAAQAVLFDITTAGSSAQGIRGVSVALNAGYTGGTQVSGFYSAPNVTGNGALTQAAYLASVTNPAQTNVAYDMVSVGSQANKTAGFRAQIGNGASHAGALVGVESLINHAIGNTGSAVAGYFSLGATAPAATNLVAGIVCDNAAIAAPCFIARDNGAALPTTGATATTQIMDGAQLQLGNMVLTTTTATAAVQAQVRTGWHSYEITTAMVNTALGAGTTGDVSMFTMPAKTVLENAYVIVTEAAAGPNTLTIACGRTSALYIDYIVASDAKAAANTVYGDASAERGTNLTGYDLPSYTGTTTVNCHFIAGNTTDLTTGQYRLDVKTSLVP